MQLPALDPALKPRIDRQTGEITFEAAVMFVDISGITRLTERLADDNVEQLITILNEVFGASPQVEIRIVSDRATQLKHRASLTARCSLK